MSTIRLSKKYGVNPTICKCIFCGKDKHLALLGHLGGRGQDLQAPMECVLDYEPCDECKKHMESGVALIEASDMPQRHGLPPIKTRDGEEIYPVGRMLVVNTAAWSEAISQECHDGDAYYVCTKLIDDILEQHSKLQEVNHEKMSNLE